MANLKDIVYCSEEQLKEMASGTPVQGHEYDENDLYITPLGEDIIIGAEGSNTSINDNNELIVDLSTKATNPENPVVGQWGRVASIGEDGQPVWETADLPIATASLAGVVRLGTGLRSLAGVVTPSPSSYATGIANRKPGELSTNTQSCYAPITPNNADYMILRSLTDGVAPAWTADEQSAAQRRIGILSVEEVLF